MKFSLTQVLGILAVFAGTVFATMTYTRMTDSTTHEAKVRQSYVDALIRDFTREAEFLATQIEAAKADSIRMEALIAQTYADDATPERILALLQADMGPIVDSRNPLGFGVIRTFHLSGSAEVLPKPIRQGLASILDLQADIRYETEYLEWIAAQSMAWKGDDSATEIDNATTRVFGQLMLKRHSLETLTVKRRLLLAETTHMLALLNETNS
jgi:hypothetical protein